MGGICGEPKIGSAGPFLEIAGDLRIYLVIPPQTGLISAQVDFLEYKKILFTTAFFILFTASTWAGFITSHFFFGNLCFYWIQQYV